jgi:hypothetical protein
MMMEENDTAEDVFVEGGESDATSGGFTQQRWMRPSQSNLNPATESLGKCDLKS